MRCCVGLCWCCVLQHVVVRCATLGGGGGGAAPAAVEQQHPSIALHIGHKWRLTRSDF